MLRVARACASAAWRPHSRLFAIRGMARVGWKHGGEVGGSGCTGPLRRRNVGISSSMRTFCSAQSLQTLRTVRVTHGWDTKEVQVPDACTVHELLEKLSGCWDIDPATATLYESKSKQKLDSASGSMPLFNEDPSPKDGAYRLLLLAPSSANDPQDSFEDRMWLFCTTTDSIHTIASRVAAEAGVESPAVLGKKKTSQRLAKHLYPSLLAFSRQGQETLDEPTRTALRAGKLSQSGASRFQCDAPVE